MPKWAPAACAATQATQPERRARGGNRRCPGGSIARTMASLRCAATARRAKSHPQAGPRPPVHQPFRTGAPMLGGSTCSPTKQSTWPTQRSFAGGSPALTVCAHLHKVVHGTTHLPVVLRRFVHLWRGTLQPLRRRSQGHHVILCATSSTPGGSRSENTTACGACITSRVPFPGHPAVHVRARTGNRYPPLTGVSFQTRAPKLTSLHWSECATERHQNFSCSDVCPIDCTFEASRLVHTKNATCYTGTAGYKANWRLTKTELTFSRDATVPSTDGVSCKEQRRKQLAQFDQLNHSGSCPGGGVQDGNEAADTVLRLSFRPADKTAKEELLTIAPNATLCIKEDEATVYCPILTPPEKAIAVVWSSGNCLCGCWGSTEELFLSGYES